MIIIIIIKWLYGCNDNTDNIDNNNYYYVNYNNDNDNHVETITQIA